MTHPPRPWSLRKRLTWRVLLLVVGGWIATIVLAAVAMDHEMNEMFDQELMALVETTVSYLDTSEGAGIPRALGVETSSGERVLRILSPDQTVAPAPWAPLATDGFHDAAGWRILRRTAEGSVIEVAHSTDWRREEMFEAAEAFLYLAIPLVLLLLFGLRRFVAQTTEPVTALASAVAGRRPDDLSPVGSGGLPQELRPLAEAFDGYLARIGTLRKAERDFVANAAHELRTPLAALRGRLELSSDTDAVAAVDTVDALTRRVERLLQLARLEAGVGIGRGPSDLLRILRLLIDDMRPASRHPIRFDDSDLDRLIVPNDADALAILLRNLLENALEHGTGEVRMRLQPDATLTIENPTTRDSLPLERFERGEGSGGLGLGLSIIDAMADAMDVPMTRTVKDGRVRYELHFALHQPESPSA
ncbi:MAG: histidine kinase dimerization/phospho-acceptor domain-containing protein [Gemmobacter sp.]